MKRLRWIATAMVLVLAGGLVGLQVAEATEGATGGPSAQVSPLRRAYWRATGIRTAPLELRVVDATNQRPIVGAGCIVGETGQRVETGENGVAPVINAPIFRNPRLEQMLAELHGQLTVICYNKGYRDAIYMGVRMDPGATNETEVWMYPIGAGDRRVEPTLYQVPIHRLWRIRLADKYRLRDEGEGAERPDLTRPGEGPAPQTPEGGGIQTAPFQGGPPQ